MTGSQKDASGCGVLRRSARSRGEEWVPKEAAGNAGHTSPPHAAAIFAADLRDKGVAAVAADAFAVSASPNAVRICLGGPTDRAACRQALKIVEEAGGAVPPSCGAPSRSNSPGRATR